MGIDEREKILIIDVNQVPTLLDNNTHQQFRPFQLFPTKGSIHLVPICE